MVRVRDMVRAMRYLIELGLGFDICISMSISVRYGVINSNYFF